MTLAEIENAFTYHKPTPEQIPVYEALRELGGNLARSIYAKCPESRERALALTKLREAIMWANAAVACNK